MPGAPNIHFHYLVQRFHLKHRTRLKGFIKSLITKERRLIDAINYIFCSDEYLLQINQDYLKHQDFTDIITFQLNAEGAPILADIYISIDRVKDNALSLEVSFTEELHRVIFHGALHLCGYKDKSASANRTMRMKEDYYLSRYFVSRETRRSKL